MYHAWISLQRVALQILVHITKLLRLGIIKRQRGISGNGNNNMIQLQRSICETCTNISGFQIGLVLQNFLFGSATSQHI